MTPLRGIGRLFRWRRHTANGAADATNSPASRRDLLKSGAAVLAAPIAAGGATEVLATGDTATRVAKMPANRPTQQPVHVVNVREFGAKADGVTNDAPALNAAIHYIRDHQTRVLGFPVCHKLLIPCGVYSLNDSIDMTLLRCINMVIDGDGSVLLGRCAGQPVIDALGSRWLTIRDLTIIGDKAACPSIGMQIGRLADNVVADDHRFDDVKILGHYSLACLLNLAAETSGFDHVLLWNDRPDPNSYCLIQDGLDHFDTVSRFQTGKSASVATEESFNENEFINCDFRHTGGGIPVWLGDTSRHRFIRCYAAGVGEAAFVVYCGQHSHAMLDVDCHCETEKLKSAFLFTGVQRTPTIFGFSHMDHSSQASGSIFRCDPHIERVILRDTRIQIGEYFVPTCKTFDDPRKWDVAGQYAGLGQDHWNGESCFTGFVQNDREFAITDGVSTSVQSGKSNQRPRGLGATDAGRLFLDRSKNKLIVWSGTGWIDTVGNQA
jgi:hypothetical protein